MAKISSTTYDKTYTYIGPLTGATLSDGRDVMLISGLDSILPPDDPYVASLVSQGRLQEKTEVTHVG